MDVRGVAFIGRKRDVIDMVGEPQWERFMERLIQTVPFFSSTILVTTLIPVKFYLTFHEKLIQELFDNNQDAYWLLGKKSAEYALQFGPYRSFLTQHNIVKFLDSGLSILWTRYFSEGELQGTFQENAINVRIIGLPVQHMYFDLGIMGFVHRACELVWQKELTPKKIAGIFSPPHEVHYMFTLTTDTSIKN